MDIATSMLRSRDVQQEIKNLPQTLSSWDSCMAKNFCKYPVIVGCVIGGLILFSCIWCLIRCICCGVACCSCCCGGCGGRKTKTTHVEIGAAPPAPPIYRPPSYQEAPKYAYTTDRSGKVTDDALPAMPTWETQKIEVKEEVELGYVNNDGHRRNLTGGDVGGSYPNYIGTVGGPGQGQQRSPSRGPSPSPQLQAPVATYGPGVGQQLGINSRGPSPGPQGGYMNNGRTSPVFQQQAGYIPPQQSGYARGGSPAAQQYDNQGDYGYADHQQPHGQAWGSAPKPLQRQNTYDDSYQTMPMPMPSISPVQRTPTYNAYPGPNAQAGGYRGQQQQFRQDDELHLYDDRQRKQQEWSALG